MSFTTKWLLSIAWQSFDNVGKPFFYTIIAKTSFKLIDSEKNIDHFFYSAFLVIFLLKFCIRFDTFYCKGNRRNIENIKSGVIHHEL